MKRVKGLLFENSKSIKNCYFYLNTLHLLKEIILQEVFLEVYRLLLTPSELNYMEKIDPTIFIGHI